MKNQALFSPKDKSKKIKMSSLQSLFGALRLIVFSPKDKSKKLKCRLCNLCLALYG